MVLHRSLLFFCLVSGAVNAQSFDRYFVSFKDKTGTPYSVSTPSAFLSSRALARRSKSGIQVTSTDLPVNPSYVTNVHATGAKTFFTSRWMNGVLVQATTAQLSSISALTYVSKVEMVAPGTKLIGGRVKQLKQKGGTNSSQVTDTQLKMLGIDKMQEDGFHGEGILMAILDDGFPGVNSATPFQQIFTEGRVLMTKDFVTNSSNVYQFDSHGTEVFSTIAAQIQGSFNSGAHKANYLLFVTEDNNSEYRIEEYNWLFAAEKADSAGADVIQSSLGYNTFDDSQMDYLLSNMDGKTTVVAKAAGLARDRAIVVVVSAGNEGNRSWHYITSPADADGILAVGSVNYAGSKSAFSSFGPTADGRIKPDVAALGQSVSVIEPNGSLGTSQGTSFASPGVASLTAGLLQAFPQLTPAALIDIIKLTATHAKAPDNSLGFGIPSYVAVKNYMNSTQINDKVTIYPNPAAATLKLVFKDLPVGSVEVAFFDSVGKFLTSEVSELSWQSNPLELSVSGLAPGCYFLQIKTSSLQTTLRFVKL